MFILGKMNDGSTARARSSSRTRRGSSRVKIDPSQIGLLIGKGGETIRGLQEQFESQIDVNDEGQVLVYASNGELGDALAEHIRSMMKEVEVGDEFNGKVVKTTTFGAFVELSKGTDGLLHISNIAPGQRPDTVEEVLNKGDEIKVRVVEVDRERGRIGLRLADDPDIAGKSVEELAAVGAGPAAAAAGGPRGGDRGRPRRRAAGRAARAARAPSGRGRDPERGYGWHRPARAPPADSGVRIVTESMDSVRSVALGFWIGTGSSPRTSRRPVCRTCSSTCCSAGPTATARWRSTSSSTPWAPSSTRERARRRRRSTPACWTSTSPRRFDVMHEMVWKPRIAADDLDNERQIVLEEIAMYEDDPQDKVFDVLGEAIFGGHPLGRAVIGRADVVAGSRADVLKAFHAAALRPAQRRAGRGRARSTTTRSWSSRSRPTRRPCRPSTAPLGAAAARTDRRRGCGSCRKDTEQYHVCLGAPGIARDDERRWALRVLDNVLGGTSSSRLFQEVRERRGLAYSVYSFSARCYAGTGQVGLYVGTRPDNVGAAMRVVGDRARALRRRPGHGRGARPLEGERQGAHGARAGVHVRADEPPRLGRAGPVLSVDEIIERVDAVTVDDVRGLAAELYAQRLSAAGVGGDEAAFARRSSRSRPRSRRPRDPRRRRRGRGPHGRHGVRRRRGAAGHGAHRARRPGARRRAVRRPGRRRRPRRLHGPGHGAREHPARRRRGRPRRRRHDRLRHRRATMPAAARSSSRRTSRSARCS